MNTGRKRKFSVILALIGLVVMGAGLAKADIIHGGGTITGNSVWSDTGDDHVVTGNITIASGASLTIQPGCVVKFDHGLRLTNRGVLNIPGTAADGVLLTRRDPTDEWSGLLFDGGSSGSLEYCTIEHVTRYDGIAVYANASDVVYLDHCVLHENDYGLYARDASPDLENCQITNNNLYGIYLTGACTPSFGTSLSQWNDIYDNGGTEPDRDLRNGTENVYARYVYWGTVTQSAIENRIRHRPDNEDLGQVYFSPWTNAAHDTEYGGGPSGVEDDPEIVLPTVFRLAQNYPNPFNPATTISYDLPTACHVELTIMDVAGRRLATLFAGHQEAGFQSLPWDARRFGSGIYLYRIKAGKDQQIRKMTLLR